MEGPPTRMMYSESAARALLPSASKSTSDMDSRRITPMSRTTIYAGDENLQAVGRSTAPWSDRQSSFRGEFRFDFAAHEILPRLAFSNQRELVAAHQDLRRQRTRIVIRSHYKSVGARAHDGDQIALAHFWHFAIKRKKIAALANRSNNVDLFQILALAFCA